MDGQPAVSAVREVQAMVNNPLVRVSTPLKLFSTTVCLTFLSACGGTSATPTTPSSTSTPCVQTTLLQGTGQVPGNTADVETFTTTATGRVDMTVDWTTPSTVVGLAVAQNPCTFDQLKAGSCTILLNSMSPPKPLKGSIANVSPGTYVLFVGNTGSGEESITLRVVLNSGTCPAPSSAAVQSQSFGRGIAGTISNRLQQ